MNQNIGNRIDTKIQSDTFGQVFHLLKMKSVFYTCAELKHPWGIEMPPIENSMMFHLVISGSFIATVKGVEKKLTEGDFIIIPNGEGHLTKSESDVKVTQLKDLPFVSVTELYETLSFGGEGELCELVCGAVTFDHPIASQLVELLPDYIIADSKKSEQASSLQTLMKLLAIETKQLSVGGEAVITRLADIVVIQAIREYMSSHNELDASWLSALKDKRIGAALALIHEKPGTDWSLAKLAEKVNMSRTSFAQLFKSLVGNTPIDYLTDWRMSIAYNRLLQTNDKMLSIALDLGYQSESSFSRAFKKYKGYPPGDVRKGI